MCSVVFPFNIFIGNSTSSLKSIDFHNSTLSKPYCSEPWLSWKIHPLFSCRCFIWGDNLAILHWIIQEWPNDVWLITSYFQTIELHYGCKLDFISHYKIKRMASHLFTEFNDFKSSRAPFLNQESCLFSLLLSCFVLLRKFRQSQVKFAVTIMQLSKMVAFPLFITNLCVML